MARSGGLQPGFVLSSRWRIRRLLGSGGMGEVYEVDDLTEAEGPTPRALKTIRADLVNDELCRQRFLRECEVVRSLEHPGIVRLHDFATEGDVPFFVMDLLPGESLASVIQRRGPMAPQEALTVVLQLHDALSYAHERGVIHRDIKPSNVFLSGRTVVLTDFGVASLDGQVRTTLTTSSSVIGTPAYLAPEQVLGQAGTRASDIYALGTLLFELLTGRLPFPGDTPLAQAVARLTRSPLRLRDVVPDLPRGLEDVVSQCLAREPTRRPVDPRRLRELLEGLLVGGGSGERKRRPVTWVAVVVLLSSGSAILWSQGRRWNLERQPASAPGTNDGSLSARVVGSLTDGRDGSSATVLVDGRVLLAGGTNGEVLKTAELFDPGSDRLLGAGLLKEPRRAHTATRLRDGRVLIVGGDGASTALGSAELYDPGRREFDLTGSMGTRRDAHTATLLLDGRVLVVGGGYADQKALDSAEIYDPEIGSFRQTGPLHVPRIFHDATRLPDGQVLITGGWGPESEAARGAALKSAELYDPKSETFSLVGSMAVGRYAPVTVPLRDGRVFVVGGWGLSRINVRATEIFDPRSGQFSAAGELREGRTFHTAVPLADGRVLVAGGQVKGEATAALEVLDPEGARPSRLGQLAHGRYGHVAALLLDGRVLIAGGYDGRYLKEVEIVASR